MVSAVQKSYRKNILREMKGNASRMVSLFGIVALGVMMLTGLMSIAPSMRSAAQKYYVQQNVFDLRVLSTLGLSEEDIAAIRQADGVEQVEPGLWRCTRYVYDASEMMNWVKTFIGWRL